MLGTSLTYNDFVGYLNKLYILVDFKEKKQRECEQCGDRPVGVCIAHFSLQHRTEWEAILQKS